MLSNNAQPAGSENVFLAGRKAEGQKGATGKAGGGGKAAGAAGAGMQTRRGLRDITNKAAGGAGQGEGKGGKKAAPGASVVESVPVAAAAQSTAAPQVAPAQSAAPGDRAAGSGFSTQPATRRGKNIVPSNKTATDIDARDAHELVAVTEYVEDLYAYLRERETETAVDAGYMEGQPSINERMRSILIDWLAEVHLKFKLVPDTMYLTVYIIDKYLETEHVTRQNLQLVGVTAMLLASKYEEIYPPEIRDLVHITDRAYNKEQILEMETAMANALEFRLTVPTIYCFLLRYLKAAHADKRIVQLSCYVSERMLQELRMLDFLPSVLACCAIYIARKNLQRHPWSPTLVKYTHYHEADLQPCLEEIDRVLRSRSELVAIKKKFSSQKFGAVALMDIDVLGDASM